MGHGFQGMNGAEYSLPYGMLYSIFEVLGIIEGKEMEFDYMEDGASNEQCRHWSVLIRQNIDRMRLIQTRFTSFLFLDGDDLRDILSRGYYKVARIQDLDKQLPADAKPMPLDEGWRADILEFAEFLETCEGIVPPHPFNGRPSTS